MPNYKVGFTLGSEKSLIEPNIEATEKDKSFEERNAAKK